MTVPIPPPIVLSQITPDFEDIASQLISDLSTPTSTWADKLTVDPAQSLIQIVAGVGAASQLSIIRALQESMGDTAQLPSSRYIIARMFSIHIQRKISANTVVTLTNKDITQFVFIPAYSQFNVDNDFYFNRTAITFNVGVATQIVTLYQGTITTQDFISDGTPFQSFIFGLQDFSTSDIDLFCIVNGTMTFNSITNGIWNYGPNDQIFYENSYPSGEVEVRFGNNIYGKIPPINSTLVFTYALVSGVQGNVSTTGRIVSIITQPLISGVTTTPCVGGLEQKDSSFYSIVGPTIFAANQRAVTRTDYVAQALQYPGVIDAIFRGQADIAPNDIRFMNIVYATILTNPLFTDIQFQAFITYLKNLATYQVFIERADPSPVPVTVSATISCKLQSNLASIMTTVLSNLNAFFTLKVGSLGFSIYRSDLHDIILNSDPNIVFVVINSPNNDILVNQLQYVTLSGTPILTMNYTTRSVSP